MKATRFLVVPLIALAFAASCGGSPTKVESGSPSAGVSAGESAAGSATTTTTVPKVKTTALSDLDEVPGSTPLESGTLKINASVMDDSLYAYACLSPAVAWDLNRSYTHFKGTIGVDDNASPDDQVTVTFKADGNQVASANVKLGTPSPVEFDLSNVLRLSVEVSSSGKTCAPEIGQGTRFAIGNGQLTPKS
jgi:hypothetical protein